ncbi:MAG: TolC family protein, partial [Calditrichia bacterium]|nr:TolC family protein [Calditrichia bacterium]
MVKYVKSFLILVIFFGRMLFAQDGVLNEYVKYGLESNLALNQQKISLEQSIQSLKEARGMFFPSINIDARYSRAGGGRIIDFPVGDLLNPVYQTLNQMLGQQRFPQIENETIDFLREEEHDTKIRLIQPIFQPVIYYNYKAKSYEKDLHEAELNVFKRQLTAEIKSAYFNYLKATKFVDIYNKTKLLLIENLRISNKLFHAQTVTKDVIYRAKSELSSLQQQLMVAENQQKLAQSYFNFLLNKPLTSVITIEENMQLPGKQELTFEMAQTNALENREELVQLKNAIYATDNGISAQRSNYFP